MKIINKFLWIVCLAIMCLNVNAQDKLIKFKELPKVAQNFIITHYNANQVSYIQLDKEFLSSKYEVKLKNGVEIEFDSKGNWTEVDAKHSAVPKRIVNPKVTSYVTKRFPGEEIVQISKDRRKIEVELTSGIDLVFKSTGEFVRIDD